MSKMRTCPLCGQMVPELLYDLHRSVDALVVSRMKRDFPGWSEQDGVCAPCLERYQGTSAARKSGNLFTSSSISSVWIPR